MPLLSEYIGHLLSEITRARVQADMEAVRIAEMYAEHPLLKHFSVPRFRVPTITLDVPVVVKGIHSSDDAEPAPSLLREVFDALVDDHVRTHGVKLNAPLLRVLKDVTNRVFDRIAQPQGGAMSLSRLADDLVDAHLDAVRTSSLAKPDNVEAYGSDLRKSVRLKFAGLRRPGAGIEVGVTTGELSEARADNTARFHLSVTEEGMEWTLVETGGKTEARLLPE
jgi:hypothetical protein